MKKLNDVVYNKLVAQAEEAKDQGKIKLATRIYACIGAHPADEMTSYSYTQLEEDIRTEMWKAASNVINYYGLESINAESVDAALIACAEIVLKELEDALGIESGTPGPLEPKVPGEYK